MSIRGEIIKATSTVRRKGEGETAFLDRLVVAANELTDDDYKALSKDAKDWLGVALVAYDEEKDIPAFPDEGEAEEEPEEQPASTDSQEHDEEDEEMAAKAKSKSDKTAVSRGVVVKKDKAKKSVATGDGRAAGRHALRDLREIILNDLSLKREEVMAEVKRRKLPLAESSIIGEYGWFRTVLKHLKDSGVDIRKLDI